MQNMERRTFLGAAMAALPFALTGQSSEATSPSKAVHVAHGEDRFGEHHVLGVSSTNFKVSTGDSGGRLLIIEHANQKKGGPPRHLHHREEEWFYAVEGEYLVEIGSESFNLKPGDCVLAPREVPHVWAFVGDKPGRLLITFAPANKMQEYFRRVLETRGTYSNPDNAQQAKLMHEYGMELIGPPLAVG